MVRGWGTPFSFETHHAALALCWQTDRPFNCVCACERYNSRRSLALLMNELRGCCCYTGCGATGDWPRRVSVSRSWARVCVCECVEIHRLWTMSQSMLLSNGHWMRCRNELKSSSWARSPGMTTSFMFRTSTVLWLFSCPYMHTHSHTTPLCHTG